MEYRLYGDSDAEKVLDFIAKVRNEGADISLNDYRQPIDLVHWNRDGEVVVIAMDGDVVAGLGKGVIGRGDKRHSAELTAAIASAYRGRGLAPLLTDRLNEELASRGVLIVRAYVYSDNAASVRTIEKQGFTLAGRVLMHHRDPQNGHYVDDLIYHKRIGKE